MRVRNFLIPLFLVVLIGFVVAQQCSFPTTTNGTHYCDVDGQFKLSKINGENCSNHFECINLSCFEGKCQSRFIDITLPDINKTGILEEIWLMIQGIECNPVTQSVPPYHCEPGDNHSYLCGVNAVWEDKGVIPGECGVPVQNCSDGNVTGTEECDDGNLWNNDSCLDNCTWNTCGDNFTNIGVEECDDGNLFENDSCYNDCTMNLCGDGILNIGVEECDDGNNLTTDNCTNLCEPAVCGDNIIWDGFEQCDDGANGTGDGCNDECLSETCDVVNVTNCSGFYVSFCNASYLWEPINLTLGECGVECLPVGNDSCNGTQFLLCNSSYVWDNQGLVDGRCGYARPSGGGGGGRTRKGIEIIIFSPIEGVTYSSTTVPLLVSDSENIAEFWRYSLNGAKKLDFVPNTTIFPSEGLNNLEVFARETSLTSREESRVVDFNVVLPDPVKPGYCGDELCQEEETCENCEMDCGICPIVERVLCGNEECDIEESSFTCPLDCIARERTDYTPVAIGVVAASVAVLGFVLYRRFFASASKFLDPRAGE